MAKTLASNSKFMNARSKIKARVSQYISNRSTQEDESDIQLVDIDHQTLSARYVKSCPRETISLLPEVTNNISILPIEIWLYYILPKMAVEDVQNLRGVCKDWFEMVTIYWKNNGKQKKQKISKLS